MMKTDEHDARFKAEAALQQHRYCDAFKLWRDCSLKRCRKLRTCSGDAKACLRRALDRVPRAIQWQAREDILAATPRNIGAPERAARQCMPYEFYVRKLSAPAQAGEGDHAKHGGGGV
jgi:hypothetical protein